ncbi:MAG: phage virion morphogenesis protein [Fusobacteriaceae bacterium]
MIKGIDKLIYKLNVIEKKSKDLRPLLQKIGEDAKTKISFNFRSEKSPKGVAWKKSKREGKTLSDTGSLKKSLGYTITEDSVVIGTNKKYATTMQYGARKGSLGSGVANVKAFTRKNGTKVKAHERKFLAPWGDIPARPFIGFSEKMRDKYKKMTKEYFLDE